MVDDDGRDGDVHCLRQKGGWCDDDFNEAVDDAGRSGCGGGFCQADWRIV